MNGNERRIHGPDLSRSALPCGALTLLALEEGSDRRRFRAALGAAVAAHLLVFAVRMPAASERPAALAEKPKVFVVQPLRFKPPEPPPPEPIPQPQVTRVPIPDPTPDDPEPIRPLADLQAPNLLPIDVDVIVDFPAAPPPIEPAPEAPLSFDRGLMAAPVRISGSDPAYTEVARRARIQGVVIVRAVIDREGNVNDLKLVKDLGLGLGQSTLEAVSRWRFRPATLRDKPIAVFYDLSVHFGLQ